ncbi:MAG: alkaline phosphatase D [Limisphaerales bacterium]|jgi:alkaline phosphatase D
MPVQAQNSVKNFNRSYDLAPLRAMDDRLAPFYHGVASGDPQPDGVILWTRLTTEAIGSVSIDWEVSVDTSFTSITQSGTYTTDAGQDFTVKVVLSGLLEGTTYYYRFISDGDVSITGRTRTADQDASQLKFAVVSCNSYQAGYFNAFGRIAERNDIDAVIHLGDFIYEYEHDGTDWVEEESRYIEPETEIIELNDYRMRYNWYRLDADLRRVMQQHPFIFIYDDHETANNSWKDGAENHNSGEGSWEDRKQGALQAYFEWVPITDEPSYLIRRTISYGSLAEWIMIDTRIEGREEQIYDFTDPALWDADRTILGTTQFDWYTDKLKNSSAQWKLIGNQVVFAPLLLIDFETLYPGAQNSFLDVWNGYPAEREKIIDTLINNNIDDVVYLTGDVHISVALDVPKYDGTTLFYDETDASGSACVEFVVTSITSDNFDERFGSAFLSNLLEGLFAGSNPHGKYNEFDKHGYLMLDITPARVQGDYYYVGSKLTKSTAESWDLGWFTATGDNHLQEATAAAPPKAIQETPAPDPTAEIIASAIGEPESIHLWNVYPNPFTNVLIVGYSLLEASEISLKIYDIEGKEVFTKAIEKQSTGHYKIEMTGLGFLSAGNYLLEVKTSSGSALKKLIKE